jgi:hypothetical protein
LQAKLTRFSKATNVLWYNKKENIIKMLVLILAVIIGIGSVYLLGDKNPVEEIAEKVIEEEIGIDVDLTPKNKKKTK